jgi:hypothetical protein
VEAIQSAPEELLHDGDYALTVKAEPTARVNSVIESITLQKEKKHALVN